MFAEAENRGALLGLVAADALEDGGAVAHDVREDVDLRVVPANEFAVVPDFFGLRDSHCGYSASESASSYDLRIIA